MKTKLLPCPFCGSDSLFIYGNPVDNWITCHNCNANGPTKDTKRKAINAWNRRKQVSSCDVTVTQGKEPAVSRDTKAWIDLREDK
jgi:Lar family restriction alleviation protein